MGRTIDYSWDVEEPILAKRWEIDCIDITLTQNDTPNNPRIFCGKGFLRQNAEGVVAFRLYPANEEQFEWTSPQESPNDAGKLYSGDHYYSLVATDWWERVWKCRRVNPGVSSRVSGDQHVRVIDGLAFDLDCEKKTEFGNSHYFLKMVWNVDVEIPATTTTEVITMRGNKRVSRSGSMNAAIFPSEFGEFRIWTEPGRLVLICETDSSPHASFFIRVTEAISFVFGRRLSCNFVEEHRNGTEITRLFGQAQSDKLALPEPVGLRGPSPGCSWRLFLDYLRFIAQHNGDKRPPSSIHLFSVMQAHQGTINARALALGVAVEGICKSLFPESPESKAKMKGWVKELRKHCAEWPGFTDTEAHSALFKRVDNFICNLPTSGPHDLMKRLVAEGAISESHVKAWKQLRNGTAHANEKVADSTQKLIDLCGAVTVLLYQLIFTKIGYEGPYTDYSAYGYPVKSFSIPSLLHENKV